MTVGERRLAPGVGGRLWGRTGSSMKLRLGVKHTDIETSGDAFGALVWSDKKTTGASYLVS